MLNNTFFEIGMLSFSIAPLRRVGNGCVVTDFMFGIVSPDGEENVSLRVLSILLARGEINGGRVDGLDLLLVLIVADGTEEEVWLIPSGIAVVNVTLANGFVLVDVLIPVDGVRVVDANGFAVDGVVPVPVAIDRGGGITILLPLDPDLLTRCLNLLLMTSLRLVFITSADARENPVPCSLSDSSSRACRAS